MSYKNKIIVHNKADGAFSHIDCIPNTLWDRIVAAWYVLSGRVGIAYVITKQIRLRHNNPLHCQKCGRHLAYINAPCISCDLANFNFSADEIEVKDIPCRGIVFKKPYVFTIFKIPNEDMFCAFDETIGAVYAQNILDIEKEAKENVLVTWDSFVDEEDKNLENDALLLKQKILDNVAINYCEHRTNK